MTEAETIELPASPVDAATALLGYFGMEADKIEVWMHRAPRLEGMVLGQVLEVRCPTDSTGRLYLPGRDWLADLLVDLCEGRV